MYGVHLSLYTCSARSCSMQLATGYLPVLSTAVLQARLDMTKGRYTVCRCDSSLLLSCPAHTCGLFIMALHACWATHSDTVSMVSRRICRSTISSPQ